MGRLENNFLSNDNESFDSSLGGWGVNANCTIARTTANFYSGPAAMRLTSSAAGGFSALLGSQNALVLPSTTYTVGFRAFSATAGLSCQINVDWYTSGGVSATLIGSATTTAQAIGTSTWTRVSNVVTSPPNAAEARFSVGNATAGAAGVIIDVDDVQFAVIGQPVIWTPPQLGFMPGWSAPAQPLPQAMFPVQATPIFNNGNTSSTPSGVTATITCASSRAHSLMVLVIHLQSSTETITSVTDNLTSTWLKAVDLLTSGSSTSIWYLDDSPAGITSVSATMTAGTSYNGNVSQWTSVSGLRGVNTASMTTSPNNSGVIAALTGDLVIGGISSNSGTARTVSPPTSELSQGALPASWTGKHGYVIPSADGSYELDWTTASAANTGGVVAVFAGLLNPIATGSAHAVAATAVGVSTAVVTTVKVVATTGSCVGVAVAAGVARKVAPGAGTTVGVAVARDVTVHVATSTARTAAVGVLQAATVKKTAVAATVAGMATATATATSGSARPAAARCVALGTITAAASHKTATVATVAAVAIARGSVTKRVATTGAAAAAAIARSSATHRTATSATVAAAAAVKVTAAKRTAVTCRVIAVATAGGTGTQLGNVRPGVGRCVGVATIRGRGRWHTMRPNNGTTVRPVGTPTSTVRPVGTPATTTRPIATPARTARPYTDITLRP